MEEIKILVIEDEQQLRKLICDYLQKEGYAVQDAADGLEGIEKFYQASFHLVILDVMMPRMDGFEVCKRIREISNVPILILTARNTEFDELMGFEKGADEYIAKPFRPRILMTRVKNLLKRAGTLHEDQISIGNLKIVPSEHAIYEDGNALTLTPREYDLYYYLALNVNLVLSREQILQAVWGSDYEGDERTVDTHIKCLRFKSKIASEKIKTIRKCGYCFEDKEEKEKNKI